MTVEMFLILLTILSLVTSLCTEGVKKFLTAQKINYAANIVVLVVSVIVGGLGTIVFYLYNGIASYHLGTYLYQRVIHEGIGKKREYQHDA